TNDELHVLQVSRLDVEKWLKECVVTPSGKSDFLQRIVDVCSKAGEPHVLCLSLLRLLTRFALRAETWHTTTSSRTSSH
ncbi:hypothetical protein BJY52DRAFT_1217012, partial [Lactarius psammicola]